MTLVAILALALRDYTGSVKITDIDPEPDRVSLR